MSKNRVPVVSCVLGLALSLILSTARPALALEARITASSQASSLFHGFGPENLLDNDPATAWAEGADNAGQGEWVELTFPAPTRLARLVIRNGFQDPTWFDKYNRVKTLEIVFSDGTRQRAELADTRDEQSIDLGGRSSVWLRLVIVDVYKCLPFYNPRTTCLSEVRVEAVGESPAATATSGPAGPAQGAEPAPSVPGGPTIKASASLFSTRGETYAPENLLDDDPATVWAVDGAQAGVGQWVEVDFPGLRRVEKVGIRNGDQGPDGFARSNRVREARLVLSDGTQTTVELKDEPGVQWFRLPARATTSLRLVIVSLHPAEVVRFRNVTSLSGLEIRWHPAEGGRETPKAAATKPAKPVAEAKSAEAKPTETKAAEARPVEPKAAEVKVIEPVPAPALPKNAKPSEHRTATALMGEFAAGSQAVGVIQDFYRRLVTLDDSFPQLFARRVRDQEAYVFEVFREYQRKRKTFDKLRNALVDLDKLDMKFQAIDPDRVRVEVTGTYTVYVAETYEDIPENTVFVLVNEDGQWRILERQDGAAPSPDRKAARQ